MEEVIIHKAAGTILNMADFRQAFDRMKDGKILLTMKDYRKRSIPQNAYYWVVVVPMVRKALYDTGWDDIQTNDDAHEALKKQFIKRKLVNKTTGEVVTMTGKSSLLTIPEFNEYIERICKWAAEYLSIVIPSPNQQYHEFEEYAQNPIVDETEM